MATIVLVHGAFQGGWCWKKVTPLLRAAGHEVHAPTLTGLGERVHLLTPAVNLSTHTQDIVNLLMFEDLHDVILVGHSYAGAVVTSVAESAADRLRALIYLDAMIPEDGQSFYDSESIDDPEMRQRWSAGATDVNGALAFPGSSTVWDNYLAAWHISDPADIAWMKPRLTPHPLAAMSEPIQLPARRTTQISSSFIRCSGPPNTTSPIHSTAVKAQASGWDYHEIQTGHEAMITAPLELAALLDRIASQDNRSTV